MPAPDLAPPLLAVDLGGGSLRAALVSASGEVIASERAAVDRDLTESQLGTLLHTLTAQLDSSHRAETRLAGVAFPGRWDVATGRMLHASNLPQLAGVHLPMLFSAALSRPVLLESDVNAAAWGQWSGLTPRPARFIYVSIGTGVGGAVILDGALLRHTSRGAGHFGYLIVDSSAGAAQPGLPPGCLQGVLGGAAFATRAPDYADSSDAQRRSLALAVGLSQLAHLYLPDMIMLGGGVIDHHAWLASAAAAHFQALRSPLLSATLVIVGPRLSSDLAGVTGAALLARDALLQGAPR